MSTTNEEKKPRRKLKLVDGPTGKEYRYAEPRKNYLKRLAKWQANQPKIKHSSPNRAKPTNVLMPKNLFPRLKRQNQAETLILNWQKAIKELEYTGTLKQTAITAKRHKLANIAAWEATEALKHFKP